MSRKVVITGAGVLSALGDSPGAFHTALCGETSYLHPITRFEHDMFRDHRAVAIEGFDPKAYLGNRNFRPLDRTGQFAVTAAQFALEASGWTEEMRQEREVGLSLGTLFCGVQTIVAFDKNTLVEGPKYARPMDFANTVINAAAGQTALWHQLRGINSTVASGSSSGLQAIAYAADLIREGRARAMLAGGAEELCFPSFYGFYRTGLLAGSEGVGQENPIPFGHARNGFVLGEGAAFLMLEDLASARARGASILGHVKGHASGFDPSRGRDTRGAVGTLAKTMRRALANADLSAGGVTSVWSSANGSVTHDRHEALALADVFDKKTPPLTAIKGQTGEALGASGGFQAIALLESMRTRTLPGIPGHNGMEAGLPPLNLHFQSRRLPLRNGMINSVGYDGACCSLILDSVEG